ncbi:MAG TPA: tetratricopeptide repeat protein [Noviherbaspirillum sp.]|jgi:tetratricopeptide (TPR) repeat protein|uniref:nuclear transport factor 2 family protein n=1 Tax=Noviherbaspirillum sp. TaxID=1926288 RepID=UPI002F93FA0F
MKAVLLRRVASLIVPAAALFAAALAAPAGAADAGTLVQAREYDAALALLDKSLKASPRDPELRFLKGVALNGLNRKAEAIAVFSALTADHPTLPEPYNNLAVIHASEGRFDQARAALERAVQLNPAYQMGYENLADVYLKLAGQAYDKALLLDPGNAAIRQRLAALRNIGTGGASAHPVTRPVAAPGAAPPGDEEAALAAVRDWAKAWSAKDVSAYLAHYAPNFRTPQGEPRTAWESRRRALIEGKAGISVEILTPRVTVSKGYAVVRFRQKYVSGRLDATDRKTLVLQKLDDGWKIVEERVATGASSG